MHVQSTSHVFGFVVFGKKEKNTVGPQARQAWGMGDAIAP